MNQYVWSPMYIDAMIERDRDSDLDGTLDERLYPTYDANFNVTGLVDSSGTMVEHFVYDPYGNVSYLDPGDWHDVGSSPHNWVYLHQGGRLDTSAGLYEFRHREYDPTLGTWVQQDPAGYADELNLYQYGSNNPIELLDYDGTEALSSLGLVGTYFGGEKGVSLLDIKWKYKGDTGYIVQHVKVSVWIYRMDGSEDMAAEDDFLAKIHVGRTSPHDGGAFGEYWENWTVDGGAVGFDVHTFKGRDWNLYGFSNYDDEFDLRTTYPCHYGYYLEEGNAAIVSKDPGWWASPDSQASRKWSGKLPIVYKNTGWSDDGTVSHWLSYNWVRGCPAIGADYDEVEGWPHKGDET